MNEDTLRKRDALIAANRAKRMAEAAAQSAAARASARSPAPARSTQIVPARPAKPPMGLFEYVVIGGITAAVCLMAFAGFEEFSVLLHHPGRAAVSAPSVAAAPLSARPVIAPPHPVIRVRPIAVEPPAPAASRVVASTPSAAPSRVVLPSPIALPGSAATVASSRLVKVVTPPAVVAPAQLPKPIAVAMAPLVFGAPSGAALGSVAASNLAFPLPRMPGLVLPPLPRRPVRRPAPVRAVASAVPVRPLPRPVVRRQAPATPVPSPIPVPSGSFVMYRQSAPRGAAASPFGAAVHAPAPSAAAPAQAAPVSPSAASGVMPSGTMPSGTMPATMPAAPLPSGGPSMTIVGFPDSHLVLIESPHDGQPMISPYGVGQVLPDGSKVLRISSRHGLVYTTRGTLRAGG